MGGHDHKRDIRVHGRLNDVRTRLTVRHAQYIHVGVQCFAKDAGKRQGRFSQGRTI
jgi:hypothetical protein